MARPYKRELEYLESTGTQWIDTGVYAPLGAELEIGFSVNTVAVQAIFGGRDTSSGLNTCTLFAVNSSFRFDRTSNKTISGVTAVLQDNFVFKYENNTDLQITDITTGTTATDTISTPSTFSSYPIAVFAVNTANTIERYFSGRISYWKYWENGTLLQDFIPVLDNNDTPCMYDRVSKQLFYNQGTGEFLYGEKPKQADIYSPIPYKMNPFGLALPKSILGYAPGAFAFWDGLNNVALGTFDASSTSWKDLSGNNNDLIKEGANDPLWGSSGGLTGTSDGKFRGLYTANSPFASKFTIELVFKKPGTTSVWWWQNRNPWNTSATRGMQCTTYNTRYINLSAYQGTTGIFSFHVTPDDPGTGVCSIVYDGFTLKSFYNGTLFDSIDITLNSEQITSSPFHINGASNGLSMYSNFFIYAIRVYRRVLSGSELIKNYQLDASRFNL